MSTVSNATNIESLICALDDPRDGLRQFAIRRMVKLGAAAVPALIDALKEKGGYRQESAAIALATLGAVAVPYLMEAMTKNPERNVRWGAAWVLSCMPPEVRRSIPPVMVPAADQQDRHLPKPGESGLHGVWSDAWLSKIRERLESNRVADVVKLATLQPGTAQ
jgi:hypothetical protein